MKDHEWNIFWDYKCKVEKRGEDIFDEKNIRTTTLLLAGYMSFMGMRSELNWSLVDKKEKYGPKAQIHTLTEKLRNIKKYVRKLEKIKLDNLCEKDRYTIRECYKGISTELKWKGRDDEKPTITLITKILMAVWGETPGFDSTFRRNYSEESGKKITNRNRLDPDEYFKILLDLKDRYKKDKLNKQEKTLGKNQKPAGRLLDSKYQ